MSYSRWPLYVPQPLGNLTLGCLTLEANSESQGLSISSWGRILRRAESMSSEKRWEELRKSLVPSAEGGRAEAVTPNFQSQGSQFLSYLTCWADRWGTDVDVDQTCSCEALSSCLNVCFFFFSACCTINCLSWKFLFWSSTSQCDSVWREDH